MQKTKQRLPRINTLHIRSGLRSGSVDNPKCIYCLNDCYHSENGTDINACLDDCMHKYCTK